MLSLRIGLIHWVQSPCSCIHACLVTQSCLTLFDLMDCSPPGSSVHGISQARILEWVALPFSKGSSRPRDRTPVFCITGRFFTVWAIRKALVLAQPPITVWPVTNYSTSQFSVFFNGDNNSTYFTDMTKYLEWFLAQNKHSVNVSYYYDVPTGTNKPKQTVFISDCTEFDQDRTKRN